MSNVLDFLERMGSDARLRQSGVDGMNLAMEQAAIDPETRRAILESDGARLGDLMAAPANVCCMVHAPEDEEDEPEKDPPADDKIAASRFASARVAVAR